MNGSSNLSVRVAQTTKHWRDFYQLRRTLYRDDPAFVVPFKQMEYMQLDHMNNPFYEHAERQVFVCYRSGHPVGRIVAVVDSLHNEWYKDKVGFFGFLDCENDIEIVRVLIDKAKEWCAGKGCDQIRGPVNPSMKSEFGVLVEGNQFPPYIMMGHTHQYYDQLLQDVGLNVAKTFYAYHFETAIDSDRSDEKWAKLDEFERKVSARYPDLKFRSVDKKNFEQTFRDINELGNQVRASNYGFVPLTEAELMYNISQLRRVIRLDMVHVAYWRDRLVGFIVNIPDVNWALRQTVGKADWIRMPQLLYWLRRCPRARVIALGVDEEFRKKGVAMLLIKRLTDVYDAYKEWELSWVVEDNVKSMRAINRAIPLNKYKTYRIYEGSI